MQQRVAVTLWKLAINVEYRTLAQLMGIGRSTACPKHEFHARYEDKGVGLCQVSFFYV